ncbi:asparagine synthase (glutamine-hydrolysing) [Streptomyces sp. SLBN-118]|uniref:asparagine synthase (glutamine-hydrolyzing) n=1 Tax=Streptomyces sp. SLBN-118 TaxID=2768454 RepID=UPI001167DA8C|nr:asparagine synthase (glutamine-hydrolyzing) [Streptomyces sp. SLBN-118]TQK50648.1 asparagine synthase (glutamine-hydrolysing) [Streptomyces sp. SLBN-118]
MCGVAGIVSTSPPDPQQVRAMCRLITHRGPDGEGYHSDANAALGMRRLAIIDVVGGDQPVYNEDRTVAAVFNGEIYNFVELREQLVARGHRFATDGDTEVLVHLYEEHGEDLVTHLRGMFAFAIWDMARRRLLLARDRVGKKPLYYRQSGTSLAFASELKALMADAGVSREVDPVALHHYLTYQYVPAPWSIYRGVSKLPPGHLLVWQDGEVSVRRYWKLDFTPRPVGSEREAAERARELLLDATRVRMVSERPLGAFLSGGIDSSAVVAAMARLSDRPVKTFCIGFDDQRFDEREYAATVARRYGTDHHEFVVAGASALEVLPTVTRHFDEPFADSSAIPSFFVAELSRQHVTVVLNGDGGDESFGGYRRYAYMNRVGRRQAPPRLQGLLNRVGSALAESGTAPRLRRVGRGLQLLGERPQHRYASLMSYFTNESKDALYTKAMHEQLAHVDSYDLIGEVFDTSRSDEDVNRLMDVDVNTYLPGDLLVKVDITTMAHSLEARSPFLDHHLMEWAAGLPGRWKVDGQVTKALLKKAMAPWLPSELITRPKAGFGVPLADWLRCELRPLAFDLLTDHTARSRGLFRPEVVRGLLQDHDEGRDRSTRLWSLLQFELWHRTCGETSCDTATAAPEPAAQGHCG